MIQQTPGSRFFRGPKRVGGIFGGASYHMAILSFRLVILFFSVKGIKFPPEWKGSMLVCMYLVLFSFLLRDST